MNVEEIEKKYFRLKKHQYMYKFAMSAAIMCVNQTAPAIDMDYVIGQREVSYLQLSMEM